jgi:hypothetical protein
MSEEKTYMQDGEGLARIAVESGMAFKQLQEIYRMTKTRPPTYLEAYIKRQMSRESVRGFMAFARILELLSKYKNNPAFLAKVLMYAVMLFEYYRREPIIKRRIAAEPVIRQIVEARNMSLENLSLELYGRNMDISVKVHSLSMNPKTLSDEIINALKRMEEFSNLNLKVWIEQR